MEENKLAEMLDGLMGAICDNNCKRIAQAGNEERAEEICTECSAGDHICKILNENWKYRRLILCGECEYFMEDNDYQGNELAYCRLNIGLDGNVEKSDGCSRGKKKTL